MKPSTLLILSTALVGMATATLANTPGQAGPMMEFVSEWDMNEDGSVTLDDLVTRRADLFAMFDLNGDGTLDAEEQVNMAATVTSAQEANHGTGAGQGRGQGAGQGGGQGGGHGQGGPGLRLHAAMTAEYADSDRDGLITAAEWAEATTRLFADLDRNGDGILDQADFGRN